MAQIRTGTVYFGKNDDDILRYLDEDIRDKFSSYVRRLIREDMKAYNKSQGIDISKNNKKETMKQEEDTNVKNLNTVKEAADTTLNGNDLDASIKSIAIAAIQDYLSKSDIVRSMLATNEQHEETKKTINETSCSIDSEVQTEDAEADESTLTDDTKEESSEPHTEVISTPKSGIDNSKIKNDIINLIGDQINN